MNIHLEVKNLYISFNLEFIIEDLSFSIEKGESFVILGESGTGKSVLMKMIGMLLDPISGNIIIDGVDITKANRAKRENVMDTVGFLFQHSGLFDHLSLIENVAFQDLYIKKTNNIKESIEKAKDLLNVVGIDKSRFSLKPSEISGGMQRRVGLARTLMKNPRLILLDEPTSGLDPIVSEKINDLILETKNSFKTTMITITHDLHAALKTADRIAVLRGGNFIWCGNPSEFLNADSDYIKNFINSTSIKS